MTTLRQERHLALQETHKRLAREKAERGLTDRVLWMFKASGQHADAAAALRAKLDPLKPDAGVRKQIKAHDLAAKRARIAAETMQREEVARLQGLADESASADRARAHGEEVSRRKIEMHTVATGDDGVSVVSTARSNPIAIWSGPEHAFQKGHLSGLPGSPSADVLLTTAKTYRAAYEVSVGGITNAGGEGGGGGARGGPQIRIIEAGDQLRIMRQGLTPRQLNVLDIVCGKSQRITAAAPNRGSGIPAAARALRGGLQIVRANLQHAQRTGQTGRTVAQVIEAHAALEKMIPKAER